MRILYFTESLFPLVDGVSMTLGRLFDTLEARGIDFRVYSPFVPDGTVSWSRRVRRAASVAFPLYAAYRVSLPWQRGLAAELDRYGPDLVHVASPTPLAARALHWAERRGVPAVATFHTHFVAYFRYYGVGRLERLGWYLLRRFYRRCAAVYAPAPGIVEELRGQGIRPVELWSRGVDAARFSPRWRDAALRAGLGATEDVPLLLFVSRLVKEKDLADLVATERRLRDRGCPHRLALVGDGPLRGRLERALPDARFAGHQSGEALSRWYASGDVFVFPSTTETFANVVLEAQASGLPAVVVDRGGPQGVIRPGETGLVARANDPADLADGVERLLRDRELRRRMGRAARARAEGRHWDDVNARLLESYARVVAGSARPSTVRQIA